MDQLKELKMGVTDYGKSLRPRVYLENPLDKIQNLRELTVSPDYQSRGTFNPFYVLDIPEDDIRPSIGDLFPLQPLRTVSTILTQ